MLPKDRRHVDSPRLPSPKIAADGAFVVIITTGALCRCLREVNRDATSIQRFPHAHHARQRHEIEQWAVHRYRSSKAHVTPLVEGPSVQGQYRHLRLSHACSGG